MPPHDGRARAIRPGPAALWRRVATAILGAAVVAVGVGSCGVGGSDGTSSAAGRGGSRQAETSTKAAGSSSDRTSSATARTTYPALVRDASWVTREGERALVVSPTAYLREHAQTDVADEAWRRVVAAVPEADTPGMRDQFVCHAQFASTKDAWYLEPARPAVGYARTVMAGCNPGAPRDVG